MTVAEYMDPARFPLTTQGNLDPEKQMLVDAMNFDDLARMEEEGRPLTGDLVQRAAELREKHAARAEVAAELKATS